MHPHPELWRGLLGQETHPAARCLPQGMVGGGQSPCPLRVSESLTDCVSYVTSPLTEGPSVTVEFPGWFSTQQTWGGRGTSITCGPPARCAIAWGSPSTPGDPRLFLSPTRGLQSGRQIKGGYGGDGSLRRRMWPSGRRRKVRRDFLEAGHMQHWPTEACGSLLYLLE